MNAKTRQFSTVAIISAINLLFTFKYLGRTGSHLLTITGTALFFLLPFLLLWIFYHPPGKSGKVKSFLYNPHLAWISISVLAIISIVFFSYYPQKLLLIDRHEMISLFWDNLLSGKCPYCPRSEGTNIPGPFPFYFYLALPFYFLNEIGYLSLSGVAGFIMMAKFSKAPQNISNTVILILISSPAVIYEIFGRSTIFLNSVLILFIFIKKIDSGRRRDILLTGFLAGLILSTRSFSFLFVLMLFLYAHKIHLFNKSTLSIGMFAALTFCSTFVPVLIICGDRFVTYNPFTVQSTLAPSSYIAVIALLSLAAVFFIKRFNPFCWFTGITGVALFTGHVYLYGKAGLIESIINSSIDLSYVSMAIPFLLYGMLENSSPNRHLSNNFKVQAPDDQ